MDIFALGGASNLTYVLNFLRGWMCRYFVYLDNDDAGRDAVQKALDRDLLELASVKYSICNGQTSSEIEDCYNKDVYRQPLIDDFGVDIHHPKFRGNNKWSDRIREVFLSNAQQWNDSIEKKVKLCVANAVSQHCDIALNEHKRSSFDALVSSIENMIS